MIRADAPVFRRKFRRVKSARVHAGLKYVARVNVTDKPVRLICFVPPIPLTSDLS